MEWLKKYWALLVIFAIDFASHYYKNFRMLKYIPLVIILAMRFFAKLKVP